ncbi:MAG: hypothetical protein WBQ11_22300 [Isosphaeraceae bacterium]
MAGRKANAYFRFVLALAGVLVDPARGWTELGRGRTVAGDRVLCSRSTRSGSGSDH